MDPISTSRTKGNMPQIPENLAQKTIPRSTIPPSISQDALPIADLVEDVLDIILSMSGDTDTFLVSKQFETLANKESVWKGIATRLPWLGITAQNENWHEAVLNSCRQYMEKIRDLPEAGDDIKKLAKGKVVNLRIMNQLKEWRDARDTVAVWKTLARSIETSQDFSSCGTSSGMIAKAKEFHQWFENNRQLLAQLRELDLRGNDLAALPPEIGGLAQLRELYLTGNHLAALPPEIGGLAQLQRLSLTGNHLAALPPEIGGLAQLQRLSLTGNHLAALPPEIGGLAQLQLLYLTGNHLGALPPEIGGLAQLRELDLTGNHLAALPPEIGGFAQLQRLYLRGNDLGALPPEIGGLAQLQLLDLMGNHLAALPPEIGGLAQLRELYLMGNHLAALPPEIGGLAQLRWLDLTGNHLGALPPEIEQLKARGCFVKH